MYNSNTLSTLILSFCSGAIPRPRTRIRIRRTGSFQFGFVAAFVVDSLVLLLSFVSSRAVALLVGVSGVGVRRRQGGTTRRCWGTAVRSAV